MSAWDTTPQEQPASSTPETRRIWCCSIVWQHSWRTVSGVTVITGEDMHSAAVSSSGFNPAATARQVMSRSVITPMGFPLSPDAMTGISPQLRSTMSRATSVSELVGAQHTGSLDMNSRTYIVAPPEDTQEANANNPPPATPRP